MALTLSFDGIAEFISQQVFGNKEVDSLSMASMAVDLAFQEATATSKFISQQAEGTLALTGAGSYLLSDIDDRLLQVVKCWIRDWGPVNVMRKAEFVSRFPDFQTYSSGVPRYAVLWGKDSLFVWPDQADLTLNVLYHKIAEQQHAQQALFAIRNLAMKYAENDKETRGINFQIGQDSINKLQKIQTRSQDSPLRFLPDERVMKMNRHKRINRWPKY